MVSAALWLSTTCDSHVIESPQVVSWKHQLQVPIASLFETDGNSSVWQHTCACLPVDDAAFVQEAQSADQL